MSAFAQMVAGFFTALSAFMLRVFAARVAIRVAAVLAITAFGTALMVTFNTVVSPLAAAAFSTQFGQVIGLAFPPVAGTCLAAIVGLWTACLTYRLQVQATKVTAGI